jgi:uncharacterized membrane protein
MSFSRALVPLHRFLRIHLFYPLALSTLLCAVLVVGRVVLSGERHYTFLVWNLFLAWLPYAFAVWAANAPRRPIRLGLPVTLWVLFLPNAAYIMTDFTHLLHPRDFPIMYDIVLIFAFAWTGLLLGLTSLDLLQSRVQRRWGAWANAGFVLASTVVTGAGIYVGRFLRWNSWEIVAEPREFLREVLHAFSFSYAFAHTAVFATVVLLCHLTYLSLRGARPITGPEPRGFDVIPPPFHTRD